MTVAQVSAGGVLCFPVESVRVKSVDPLLTAEMNVDSTEEASAKPSRNPDTPYDNIADPSTLPFTLDEQATFLKVRPQTL